MDTRSRIIVPTYILSFCKYLHINTSLHSCVSGIEQKNNTSPFLPCLIKSIKGLTETPEMDCDQTAMGMQPVTAAIFLISKSIC
jgi:hypothetical protein